MVLVLKDDTAEYAYRRPHPRLVPYVVSYTGLLHTARRAFVRRVAALGTVVLAIDLVAPQRRMIADIPGPWRRAASSPVSGLSDRPMVFEQSGSEHGMTVELTAPGAFALLGLPLRELANTSLSFIDVLGDRAALLTERLAETAGWAARFDLLDDHLNRWILDGRELARPVLGAWLELISAPAVPIGVLADQVGWTRQHLDARFGQQIGVTPKTVARIARLHRAVLMMTGPPTGPRRPRWLDTATACGYADQSHLNREFRALTGCSPTELLGLMGQPGAVYLGSRLDPALRGARRAPGPRGGPGASRA